MPVPVTRNTPATVQPPPAPLSETVPNLSFKSTKRVFLILPSGTAISRAKPPSAGASVRVDPSMAERLLTATSASLWMPGLAGSVLESSRWDGLRSDGTPERAAELPSKDTASTAHNRRIKPIPFDHLTFDGDKPRVSNAFRR